MDSAQASALKKLISTLKEQPELLNEPSLAFFKDYLTSLGATIPAAKAAHTHGHDSAHDSHEHKHGSGCCAHEHESHDHGHDSHSHGHGHDKEQHGSEDEEEEPEEEDPELMAPDSDPPAEVGVAAGGEVSDADMDKAGEMKMAAAEAASGGDYAKAVECYTSVLKLMPSPLVFAKRGDCFLKLKKPNAAIRDCDKALESNPDSAKALKVRGMAKRYLGDYEAAQKDLALAQRIDYDDAVDGIQRFVIKRCADRQARAVKQKAKEAERAAKAAARRREEARREYEKQKEEEAAGGGGMPGGMPGMPGMPGMGGMGGMGGGGMEAMMAQMMQDPEMLAAMSNPKVMEAMQSCMGNPMAAMQYMNDPEVGPVLQKLMGKMMGGMPGGMAEAMGGMGGMPSSMPGGMPGGPTVVEEEEGASIEEVD